MTTIVIRRRWDDHHLATVPMDALAGFHWSQSTGRSDYGWSGRSPRPMVHAYVWCDDIPDDVDFAHSCLHGPSPHRINVVIVAKDNPKTLVMEVRSLADAGGHRVQP